MRPQQLFRTPPLQTDDTGPWWSKGKPLAITLGDWFAAEGSGSYVCGDGVGTLNLAIKNLVPNGVYTMWHDFAVRPQTHPFVGFCDLPFGVRDGSDKCVRGGHRRLRGIPAIRHAL